EDTGLAREQCALARRRQLDSLHVVRPPTEELDVSGCEVLQVERRFRIALPLQSMKSPKHSGGSDVEVLHRARAAPEVPFVRRPEELRAPEGRFGIRDDLANSGACLLHTPFGVGQRLERLRPIERHFSRKEMSCAPCQSTSSPSSCRRSPPSTMVAK